MWLLKIFYFLKGTEPLVDYNYDLDAIFKEEEGSTNSSVDTEKNNNSINNSVDEDNNIELEQENGILENDSEIIDENSE